MNQDESHTDIDLHGWVSRLPRAVRPYALLARLDRPAGTWLLLLPGWWAIMLAAGGLGDLRLYDLKLMALFGGGAVVMRAAGCVINDLWDRRLDARVERTKTRPLAAGTVTPAGALIFLALLLAGGLAILLQLSLVTVLLGVLAVPLIAVYPLAKRFTWWPQLVLGLIFNFGALMGWAALNNAVNAPALLLYAGGIFWTLGYDTIYAHQDKEDDALAGIKSTALRFGAASKLWVTGFFAVAWVLIAAAFVAAQAGPVSLAFLILPGTHLVWQLKKWDPDSARSSLKIFRANRNFGLLVLLAAVV